MAFLWAIGIMHPRVGSRRLRMTAKVKNLYNAFPHGLPLERFLNGHTLNVSSFRSVQASNGFS